MRVAACGSSASLLWAPIRSDPRFETLASRLKLPKRSGTPRQASGSARRSEVLGDYERRVLLSRMLSDAGDDVFARPRRRRLHVSLPAPLALSALG
jgi:hypothetical protein